LTLGTRVFPWADHGLALLGAFDIGTGATSEFVEEVAPEPPWNLWFGLAYAVDTVPPPPVIKTVEKAAPPAAPPAAPRAYVTGVVSERGTQTPIAGAVLRYDGRNLTGMVAADDGTFRSTDLEPGTYTRTFDSNPEGLLCEGALVDAEGLDAVGERAEAAADPRAALVAEHVADLLEDPSGGVEALEQVGPDPGRGVGVGVDRAEPLHDLAVQAGGDGAQQAEAALEVVEHRRLGDPGPLGDGVERGLDAVLLEVEGERGIDDRGLGRRSSLSLRGHAATVPLPSER
jgi:hypothetical protein